MHVTVRAAAGVPSLRGARVFDALRVAVGASSAAGFRVLQFSAQQDHVHLVVEADAPTRFVRGVQGLMIRVAKAVNRACGRVWGDRYHARRLASPREVRAALVYVLQNFKKHHPGVTGTDPCSSAAWFPGWRTPPARPPGPSPVCAPRTWLARVGWMRHGRLQIEEAPRGVPAASGQ